MPVRIELWDGGDRHVEEVIALVSTAVGAFKKAMKRRPGKLIAIRQKARASKKSR